MRARRLPARVYHRVLYAARAARRPPCKVALPATPAANPGTNSHRLPVYTQAPDLTPLDQCLAVAGRALRTLAASNPARRPCPEPATEPAEATPDERRLSGALMRVNHVGEVCAQALYEGQALTARTPGAAAHMRAAAREEEDHLAWSAQRLRALGARPSLLNPLWFGGAFAMGLVAGRLGDPFSLGFVEETERQVEAHLASHLDRLPAGDTASRAVVAQMQADEARHAQEAHDLGARAMPAPIQAAMRAAAKVMTTVAHRV